VAPAAVGSVLGEGVDDGDPPGSSGTSWGGSSRRRGSAVACGSEASIGGLRRLIGAVRWSRSSREKREGCWCAQIVEWGLPFIGAEGHRSDAAHSTWARALRRSSELGEGAAVFSASRWSSGWRQVA
jgi:hypothetical protein